MATPINPADHETRRRELWDASKQADADLMSAVERFGHILRGPIRTPGHLTPLEGQEWIGALLTASKDIASALDRQRKASTAILAYVHDTTKETPTNGNAD